MQRNDTKRLKLTKIHVHIKHMLAKIEHQPEKVNHYYYTCNHCGKIMHEFVPKRLTEEQGIHKHFYCAYATIVLP